MNREHSKERDGVVEANKDRNGTGVNRLGPLRPLVKDSPLRDGRRNPRGDCPGNVGAPARWGRKRVHRVGVAAGKEGRVGPGGWPTERRSETRGSSSRNKTSKTDPRSSWPSTTGSTTYGRCTSYRLRRTPNWCRRSSHPRTDQGSRSGISAK